MELQKMNKNNIYDLEKEAKTVVFEYYQAKRKVSKLKDKAFELGYRIDEGTGRIFKIEK